MAKEIQMTSDIIDTINKKLIQAQVAKKNQDAEHNFLSVQKISENLLSLKIIIFLNNDLSLDYKESIKKHIQTVMGLSAVKVIELDYSITSMYTLQLKEHNRYFKATNHKPTSHRRLNPQIMEDLVKNTKPDIALFFSRKNMTPLFNIHGFNINKTSISSVEARETPTSREEQIELEKYYDDMYEKSQAILHHNND